MTRKVLLEIIKLKEVDILEQNFTVDQLKNSSEIFITATGKEIMPVTKINGKLVKNGNVGPITTEIIKQHKEFIKSNKW